jgi:hypothetical protein
MQGIHPPAIIIPKPDDELPEGSPGMPPPSRKLARLNSAPGRTQSAPVRRLSGRGTPLTPGERPRIDSAQDLINILGSRSLGSPMHKPNAHHPSQSPQHDPPLPSRSCERADHGERITHVSLEGRRRFFLELGTILCCMRLHPELENPKKLKALLTGPRAWNTATDWLEHHSEYLQILIDCSDLDQTSFQSLVTQTILAIHCRENPTTISEEEEEKEEEEDDDENATRDSVLPDDEPYCKNLIHTFQDALSSLRVPPATAEQPAATDANQPLPDTKTSPPPRDLPQNSVTIEQLDAIYEALEEACIQQGPPTYQAIIEDHATLLTMPKTVNALLDAHPWWNGAYLSLIAGTIFLAYWLFSDYAMDAYIGNSVPPDAPPGQGQGIWRSESREHVVADTMWACSILVNVLLYVQVGQKRLVDALMTLERFKKQTRGNNLCEVAIYSSKLGFSLALNLAQINALNHAFKQDKWNEWLPEQAQKTLTYLFLCMRSDLTAASLNPENFNLILQKIKANLKAVMHCEGASTLNAGFYLLSTAIATFYTLCMINGVDEALQTPPLSIQNKFYRRPIEVILFMILALFNIDWAANRRSASDIYQPFKHVWQDLCKRVSACCPTHQAQEEAEDPLLARSSSLDPTTLEAGSELGGGTALEDDTTQRNGPGSTLLALAVVGFTMLGALAVGEHPKGGNETSTLFNFSPTLQKYGSCAAGFLMNLPPLIMMAEELLDKKRNGNANCFSRLLSDRSLNRIIREMFTPDPSPKLFTSPQRQEVLEKQRKKLADYNNTPPRPPRQSSPESSPRPAPLLPPDTGGTTERGMV